MRALIEQVETAYARGEADYRKGMLPEAKAEFDRAVDLMLTSGIDIKSNPQLQDEFDRIVDQVNALEMEALKQGNGFAPKVEDHARRCCQRCDLRGRSQHRGQGPDRSGHHQVRPAAGGERLRGRLHQLLRQLAEGPQHAAALLPALRPLQGNDSARHGRRRRAAGSDLPGGGRVRLSAAAVNRRSRRRRHVAVHALRRLRPDAATRTSTSASIRKSRPAPTPAT